MSDRTALVAAIAAAPDDDLPKLVFADWLDENGGPADQDRALFIRLGVAYFREATAFPPTADPAKRDRLRDLFAAHHRAWLRPVYDALARPLPSFTATQDRWSVQPFGEIVVSHSDDQAVPTVVLHGGLVNSITLHAARLTPAASLAAAMAHEPLETLDLTLPATLPNDWERLDGPHLGRVRTMSVRFTGSPGDDVRPAAELLCDPRRFRGLRSLVVTPEWFDGSDTRGTALFDTLRASPVRGQLTSLSLYDLPGAARLLARHDHGFEALRELAVGICRLSGEADALFAAGISDWFRERLTRLVIDTSRTHGLGWLTTGRPWERLERLLVSGGGVGDTGAMGLARVETLPALRELRLHRVNVSEVGAAALARSPLVGRLQALFLDRNPVTDVGARALAAALDRGLNFLALRDCQPALSPALARELSARYGSRIAFER